MLHIKIRSIKIQTRLIVSFLLLSFIPLAITSLISYKKSSDAIENKINIYSIQLMADVGRNLQTQLTFKESLCEELDMSEEIQKDLIVYDKKIVLKNIKLKIILSLSL